MKPLRKQEFILLAYHLFTTVLIVVLHASGTFSGGPCNFGVGLLVFLLVGIIMVILGVTSILMVIRNKANRNFLFINILALVIWIIALFLL